MYAKWERTSNGEIKEICDLVNPKIGIITAIGPQHLESFKSIDNIIKAKFELLEHVKLNNGTIFLNYNNEYLMEANKPQMNVVSYGIENDKLNYNGYNVESSADGIKFKMLDENGIELEFKSKLIGKHNVINIVGAIAVANYLNVPCKKLVPVIRELKSIEHRLEVNTHGNLTIIDDSYNSNPVSSKSAIDTLAKFNGKKIVVTPGLVELGKEEEKYNFEFGKYMSNVCDYIFLVGEKQSKPVLDGILCSEFEKENIFIVNTPNEAIQKISKMNINGKVNVLLENDLPDNYNL